MIRIHRSLLLFALAAVGCSGTPAGNTQTTPDQKNQATPVETSARTAAPVRTEPPKPPALHLSDVAHPTSYRATLTLDPESEAFSGSIDIDISILKETDHIWLNATDLTIAKATLKTAGRTMTLERLPTSDDHFLGFSLGGPAAPGSGTIHIEYTGKTILKEYHGVLRGEFEDRWYLYTHFQPLAARRAFPCFDEPRFKVPWELSIIAKDGHQAFANAPLLEKKAGPDAGMNTFRFAKTKPVPSYLLSFAVGPYETVDLGKHGRNSTSVRIIVPHGQSQKTRYVSELTPKLLNALEDYFDMAYPYGKLDSIALPRFFSGAMENPGLITYNMSLLVSEPDKENHRFKRRYAGIGAHEVAHMWFGDLVTTHWWNDIWLNESFATWMSAKIVKLVEPSWDHDTRRVSQLDRAIGSDSSATSRPIRRPINSVTDIRSAFDGISYEKGSAVIGMFERMVGEQTFREGMRQYMRKHAWKTATSDDFLAAISAVSQKEVPAAFATFLEQPGVPVVSVSLSCDAGKAPMLSLSQERMLPTGSKGKAAQTWQFPMCVKYGKGNRVVDQCDLVTEASSTLSLDKLGGACPEWVQANADAAGYYRIAYDDGMIAKLLTRGSKHLTSAERLGVVSDMSALVQTGKIGFGEALGQVPMLLRTKDNKLIARAARIVAGVSEEIIPEKLEANYRRFINRMFRTKARKLGWDGKKSDSEDTRRLRRALVQLVAGRAEDPVLVKQAVSKAKVWLDKRTGIDQSMLSTILPLAAKHGGKKMYQRFVAELDKTKERSERRALVYAVASTTDKQAVIDNIDKATAGKLDLREAATYLFVPLSSRDTRGYVYDHIKTNFDKMLEGMPKFAHRFMLGIPSAFCDQKHLDDVHAFFTPKAETIQGGKESLARTIERIELCMAFRNAQQKSIETFLKKY